MNTDPISAAITYQQALAQIAKARTLNIAIAIAAKALEITFAAPISDEIGIESGLGGRTGMPFVSIAVSNPVIQAPTVQARQIAMQILEAADAAESDGFVIRWIGREHISPAQRAALLQDFRAYREQLRRATDHDQESE